MGKSLENTIMNAIEKKYIQFDKNRIENIHNVDSRGVVVIIADDRQKPFGNLKRIIRGADKFITIDSEDVVVIASQVYDGMEKTATDVFDQLAKLGCNLKILSTKKYLSYHASSEDLMMMLDLMQPQYYMPVIGEYRHLVANRDVARAYGMNA